MSLWERQAASSSHSPRSVAEAKFQERWRLTSCPAPIHFHPSFSKPRVLGPQLFSVHLAHWAEVLCQGRQAEKTRVSCPHPVPCSQSRSVIPGAGLLFPAPAPEQGLRDFAPGKKQAIRTLSSKTLPKGNDFIWNRVWRGSTLRTLLEIVESC